MNVALNIKGYIGDAVHKFYYSTELLKKIRKLHINKNYRNALLKEERKQCNSNCNSEVQRYKTQHHLATCSRDSHKLLKRNIT